MLFPKQGESIFFNHTWTKQKPWWRSGPENIHLDILGESEGSLPQPQDSLPDAGEAINDFWSTSGSFIHRHHVEPRVKLCSSRRESFPIPLKHVDVSRRESKRAHMTPCWSVLVLDQQSAAVGGQTHRRVPDSGRLISFAESTDTKSAISIT